MTLLDAVAPEDDAWLQRAIELAVANVAAGGGPFGAVVVRDGPDAESRGASRAGNWTVQRTPRKRNHRDHFASVTN